MFWIGTFSFNVFFLRAKYGNHLVNICSVCQINNFCEMLVLCCRGSISSFKQFLWTNRMVVILVKYESLIQGKLYFLVRLLSIKAWRLNCWQINNLTTISSNVWNQKFYLIIESWKYCFMFENTFIFLRQVV